MNIQLIQIPALQKFRTTDSFFDHAELREQTVLRGERLCYQVCIRSDVRQSVTVSLESELAAYLKLYLVKNVVMDVPARTDGCCKCCLHSTEKKNCDLWQHLKNAVCFPLESIPRY